MASCDHSPGLGIASGLSEERLLEKTEFVRELNESLNGFTVLAGTEVDIRADGKLDYSDQVLAECDLVVAAIHSGHGQKERTMTNRIITAIENEHVDIIAHPTGRKIGEREPYQVDMEAVLEAAARTGTVMEINAHPIRLDLNDRWARRAKEMGVKMAINSDAHSVEGLQVMKYGVKTARRGWLEKEDVVNTLGLEELMKLLRKS
jgi:DNA polymerase (family 10)